MLTAVLSCCLLFHPQEPVAPFQAEGTATIGAGALPVVVEDAGGGRPDTERLLAVALRALPLIEREAGFAYPHTRNLRVRVYADKTQTGNEVGYVDQQTGVIHVWARINSALFVHELAHEWFGSTFAADWAGRERWLIEGLAQFTSVRVLARDHSLGDPVQVHRAIRSDGDRRPKGWDVPLSTWKPAFPVTAAELPVRYGWYAKAYGFFHVVRCRGGDGAVRRANTAAAGGPPVSTARYLELLAAASPALQGIGPGWVVAGPYGSSGDAALGADDDQDGLSNGEERLFGTQAGTADTDGDGESDGREVYVARTDPLDRASVSKPNFGMERGFAQGGTAELDTLYAGAGGRELCLRILTNPPTHTLADRQFNVGIDVDGDDTFDVVVGWQHGGPAWCGRVGRVFDRTDWHLLPLAIAREERTGVIELRVPASALGVTGTARLFAYVSNKQPDGSWKRGGGVGWVTVTLPKAR